LRIHDLVPDAAVYVDVNKSGQKSEAGGINRLNAVE
jgi:hypothetical protein